tara:strand:+ start:122 stop:589 length:468 start_codon:yes stop_codon:yes gene_type:complete
MNKVKMTFKDWDCELVVRPYMDPPLACIQLVGAEGTSYEHEPIAIATCNLPEQWDDFCHDVGVYNIANPDKCLSREGVKGSLPLTFIKDYSENEGMLDALLEHDIVVGFTENGDETKHKDDMLWYHNGFIRAPLVAVSDLTLIKQYREAFCGRKL